ncbi:hypothetical protein EVAR_59329_1 [Eumeta japonica]|uniref:Uncharacterized protein n=1 Tax=Eumeta variegata TaxID=151549 RepID=A0A4C1YMW8_EUMVA|nr:hypothetical protein EVAR_59329_1 [Eumeta japonica]
MTYGRSRRGPIAFYVLQQSPLIRSPRAPDRGAINLKPPTPARCVLGVVNDSHRRDGDVRELNVPLKTRGRNAFRRSRILRLVSWSLRFPIAEPIILALRFIFPYCPLKIDHHVKTIILTKTKLKRDGRRGIPLKSWTPVMRARRTASADWWITPGTAGVRPRDLFTTSRDYRESPKELRSYLVSHDTTRYR